MNAVDIYRALPKTNCGLCAQQACMPFALALLQGLTDASACPQLTESDRDDLSSRVRKTDWREDLILKLQEEVSTINFSEIAEGLGCEVKNRAMLIRCLGRDFRVAADGAISTQGPVTPWMKILLLHYIRTKGSGSCAGKWVSYAELKSGMVKATSFLRECEQPLRDLFDQHRDQAASVLIRLGAATAEGFPSPYAWRLSLLPKLPVVLLYWPGEQEFPSQAKVLFDRTADRFLDVESIMFLLEGLVKTIERSVGQSGGG